MLVAKMICHEMCNSVSFQSVHSHREGFPICYVYFCQLNMPGVIWLVQKIPFQIHLYSFVSVCRAIRLIQMCSPFRISVNTIRSMINWMIPLRLLCPSPIHAYFAPKYSEIIEFNEHFELVWILQSDYYFCFTESIIFPSDQCFGDIFRQIITSCW